MDGGECANIGNAYCNTDGDANICACMATYEATAEGACSRKCKFYYIVYLITYLQLLPLLLVTNVSPMPRLRPPSPAATVLREWIYNGDHIA